VRTTRINRRTIDLTEQFLLYASWSIEAVLEFLDRADPLRAADVRKQFVDIEALFRSDKSADKMSTGRIQPRCQILQPPESLSLTELRLAWRLGPLELGSERLDSARARSGAGFRYSHASRSSQLLRPAPYA
jgi:hypothetical protein